MRNVVSRSWFSRVWTIQEVVLARNATVTCGSAELAWTTLMRSLKALLEVEASSGDLGTSPIVQNWGTFYAGLMIFRRFEIMLDAQPDNSSASSVFAPITTGLRGILDSVAPRSSFTTGGDLFASAFEKRGVSIVERAGIAARAVLYPQSLLPRFTISLRTVRMRHSRDPEDKVYGIYGILQAQGFNDLPPVQYGRPEEIFTKITRMAIEKDQSLLLLLQLVGTNRRDNLPSWVPDFDDSSTRTPLCSEHFHTSQHSSAVYTFSGDTILELRGQIVDTIDEVPELRTYTLPEMDSSVPFHNDEESRSLLSIVQSIITLQEWMLLGMRSQHYPTGESVLNAFYKTLTCNGVTTDSSNTCRPEVFAGPFEDWQFALLANHPTKGCGMSTLLEILQQQPALTAQKQWFKDLGVDVDQQPALDEVVIMLAIHSTRASIFHSIAGPYAWHRMFITTRRGYFALAPKQTLPTDSLVLLSGLKYPFVMRKHDHSWRIVGPAYVHGMMQGELWDENRLSKFVIT